MVRVKLLRCCKALRLERKFENSLEWCIFVQNSINYFFAKKSLMKNYEQFIEINSDIRFGKPCVKGTRISVFDILGWLSIGMTETQIIEDFPELTEQTIRACLAYAA